jgi:hypothetical protein
MIKLMLLASRRQDMSREDFRTYYENVHAPLAESLHMRQMIGRP